jgi:uncharacterized protein YecE (DUF72 family)
MGWSYSFWLNNFYSANTKPEKFLEEYSKHFDTVEVNSSFYRVPSVSVLENWKNQALADFLFSVKVPKKVTHEKFAKESFDYLDYFLGNVASLGSKLGPLLFQFPPSFKSDSFDALKNLVSVLPKKYRYSMEVRNQSWFEDRFYDLLGENRIALVMNDSPWLHKLEKVTADFVYFRWEGNRKQIVGTKGTVEKDRTEEIQELAKKIRSFPDETEVFGYFSKYFSGHPPTDAKLLLEYLKK